MSCLVEMKNITKKFPGVVALKDITFEILSGQVHVLLGENGAGKSTLMKILSGAYEPTEGAIIINGNEYERLTPMISKKNGISIIYQELSVINELSIRENIFVGNLLEKNVCGVKVIDHKNMDLKTTEVLKRIGLNRLPSTMVGDLSIPEKQMVEIAKAIAFNAKVIIMDEPTSSLTTEEINQLFKIIKQLKEQEIGIVYISHKLNEIIEIGDQVTVLKDGTCAGTHEVKDVTEGQLVKMMVGREISGKNLRNPDLDAETEVILSVKNLSRKDNKVEHISFDLIKGEILGFSGLVGSGRTELMEAIYGAYPVKEGKIELLGEVVKIKTPYDALKIGIALVTENRRESGFSPYFSIKENIAQAKSLKESKMGGLTGLIHKNKEEEEARKQKESMNIKCSSIQQVITELSGGNQQKVILGKWLASSPNVIIFDEPTKGIDIGTKSEIYKLMRQLAEAGIGVIIVSSELPELISVCDRIIVFNSGKLNGEFSSEEVSEEVLVKAATESIQ